MRKIDSKMLYFLIGCITLIFVVIGATYAYFTASASDEETVKGDAATVSFGLSVSRVTTIDMAFGLVPMRNNQAPKAVSNMCYDDFGRAGCQIYKITVSADSDTVMFLDGYVVTTPRDPLLETRISQVYTDDGENFYTEYSDEDFLDVDFDEDRFIKTGVRGSLDGVSLNHADDYGCLVVENEKIGGDVGRNRDFYIMVWVYDNGEEQNYLQGLELAYRGDVTFVTAEGNEISASFD